MSQYSVYLRFKETTAPSHPRPLVGWWDGGIIGHFDFAVNLKTLKITQSVWGDHDRCACSARSIWALSFRVQLSTKTNRQILYQCRRLENFQA